MTQRRAAWHLRVAALIAVATGRLIRRIRARCIAARRRPERTTLQYPGFGSDDCKCRARFWAGVTSVESAARPKPGTARLTRMLASRHEASSRTNYLRPPRRTIECGLDAQTSRCAPECARPRWPAGGRLGGHAPVTARSARAGGTAFVVRFRDRAPEGVSRPATGGPLTWRCLTLSAFRRSRRGRGDAACSLRTTRRSTTRIQVFEPDIECVSRARSRLLERTGVPYRRLSPTLLVGQRLKSCRARNGPRVRNVEALDRPGPAWP